MKADIFEYRPAAAVGLGRGRLDAFVAGKGGYFRGSRWMFLLRLSTCRKCFETIPECNSSPFLYATPKLFELRSVQSQVDTNIVLGWLVLTLIVNAKSLTIIAVSLLV